ncbi:acetylornithine deacetylase [Angomonas deanei]|nr:acetylornithine deacetylase [Angomonas deanei]|eukprot:EPY15103.1 acetylornithine deacetylase [Angomonas deanei]
MSNYPVDTKQWLAKLVSFNTISSNPNMELVQYIEAYLKPLGFCCVRIPSPTRPDTHANLWATLPGKDGSMSGGIILSGHLDVVPVKDQVWKSDPFVLTERNGKLYGRGSSDMKGFIAVALHLAPYFAKLKSRKRAVHYSFSFDEEVGCAGVPFLIDHLKKNNITADACLVGDADFEVITGSKGIASWRVTVHGKAIHSSMALMNTSCNAVEHASRIVWKIRELALELREHGPRDKHYVNPFCAMSVGLINGGNAPNTVPSSCDFVFSVRYTDTNISREVERKVRAFIDEVVLPEMKKEAPQAKVEMKPEWFAPAFNADENHAFTKLVRKMVSNNKVRKQAGATESGFFQDILKIPTVNIGPGGFGAHCPNEFTEEKLLLKAEKFTAELVEIITTNGVPKL